MKRILLTLLLILATTYAQAKTTLSDEAIQAVKDEIARATKAGEIEGGMILVHIHGKQRLLDIQGYHDLEDELEFKADSLLRIYSMTKPITSVAAMTLWEQGRFKLDDPLSKYIPSFKKVQVGVVVDRKMTRLKPARPLTVRDLLSHTSGYSYSPASARNTTLAVSSTPTTGCTRLKCLFARQPINLLKSLSSINPVRNGLMA